MYTAQMIINQTQLRIKQLGLTQKDVLKDCGLSENALKQITDKKGIGSFSLAKIADRLNCSVDYLLGREAYVEKNSPTDLTENEYEMIKAFKDLTPTQQGKLIERAKIMGEQNEAEFQRKESV